MGLLSILVGEKPILIRKAQQQVDGMLGVAEEMLAAAFACLLHNEPLEIDLGQLDQRINETEQEVRRLVMEHLTLDPQRELGFSLVLISVVQEAERLGDIAKTLANVSTLADKPRLGAAVHPLRDVQQRVTAMHQDTRRAFGKGDAVAAQRVMDEHKRLKEVSKQYLTDLAHRSDLTSNEAVVYALAGRLMGRVSSHLSNIVSSVLVPFDQIRRSA